MNSIPPHHPEHRYEDISLLAYHLWQQAQCPPGEDLKFWLQAEQQLFGKLAPVSPVGRKAPASQKAALPAKLPARPAAKARAKTSPRQQQAGA